MKKTLFVLIVLGFFLVPSDAGARGRYLVPMFSRDWWKYTAINCAMVQARLTYGEWVYHDRMVKYRGYDVRRPFDREAWQAGLGTGVTWYPVTSVHGWQTRQKEVGTTYGN